MPPTRGFNDTIRARMERDPAFREELLQEGAECLLSGDLDTGKDVLCRSPAMHPAELNGCHWVQRLSWNFLALAETQRLSPARSTRRTHTTRAVNGRAP